MQRIAGLALITGLLAVSPASAMPLAFHSPASFDAAHLETPTVSWALLVFRNGTEADFELDSKDQVHFTNDTVHHALAARQAEDRNGIDGQDSHEERWLPGPFSLTAGFTSTQDGSVLVVAERIDFTLSEVVGTIRSKPAGESLEDFSRPGDVSHDLYRKTAKPGDSDVVLSVTPTSDRLEAPFHLTASRVRSIEWYNAAVNCRSQNCPTGGGPTILDLGQALGYSVSSEYHTYETLQGDMKLKAQGNLDYAVLGSSNLTAFLRGAVRLPLASGTAIDCESCILPDRQTLALTGNIKLADLRMAPDGSISGDLDGDLESARMDETAIDPTLLFSGRMAVGAAAVGGGVLLGYLLWLFTWNREADLLANARRRRIYDFVLEHPGVHLREALRGADVPAGSGRHHVNKLVQAGLLMAQRDQTAVLLFENHGKYEDSWRHTATVRDPNARLLLDWVAAHPASTQKAILDSFQTEHGWNRSTTQKRLDRLQRTKMVEAKTHGRYKVYSLGNFTAAARPSSLTPVAASA